MPSYDPEVIERFAARLERRAVAVRRGFSLCGAAFGALVGSVPLTPLHVAWPVPQIFGFATLLAGAAVFALIGFVVGDTRAELHRLHAQTMLATLHAQRTSLAVWRLLEQRQEERHEEPVVHLQPEPELEPVPEPAPPVLTPLPKPAPVPVAAAVQIASVPSPLRAAGVSAPPVTPPPLTG